jgi:hypothetical protein
MKIIITESQLNSAYWKYLKYILGDLTEVHVEKYHEYKFWVNDADGVVLQLDDDGDIWIHSDIWDNVSMFFNLGLSETRKLFKDYLENNLNLVDIKPDAYVNDNPWYWKHINKNK